MPLDAIIREGVESDAAGLAALATQVFLHTYATDGISTAIARHVLSEFSVARFLAIFSQQRYTLLVAVVNENLVGYAMVSVGTLCPSGSSTVELPTLYVQEHFLRRGVGSSLLLESRRVALRRAGSSVIWLSVNARNEPAKAFYEKHGFIRTGIAYFELGGEKHENHVLVSAEP